MNARSIELFELKVPIKKIVELPPHQRYAYYLLGQIYNELIALQKIISHSLPKHDDIRPARRNAEIAQAYFLFRMAASKVYEAQSAINRREVSNTLKEIVFPDAPELRDSLKELNKAVSGANWLSRMRNGMGFHYPSFLDWTKYTTPDDTWIDDIVYFGRQSGNTFFDASATVTMNWMFDKYRDLQPAESVERLVDEMVLLIKQINEFANRATTVIVKRMTSGTEPKFAGRVISLEFSKVSLPY